MRRALVALLFVFVLVFGVAASAAVAPHGPPTSIGTGGAAASVETLATQAAIDTLKAGGNAVDAAVAAAGVLGVTEPFSCGIGGGGFMVIRTAKGKVTTIDGRETAPEAMTPTSFMRRTARRCRSTTRAGAGCPSACPARLATWDEALKKYGTMTLEQVLQPGIGVATNGFVVDQTFFDQTQQAVAVVRRHPGDRRALPRSGRHAARRRHGLHATPTSRTTYERIAQHGVEGLLPRRDRGRDRRHACRHPRVAPTADHVWRPGVMTHARPRASTARPSASRRT